MIFLTPGPEEYNKGAMVSRKQRAKKPNPPPPRRPWYNPFAERARELQAILKKPAPAPAQPEDLPISEEDFFRAAMSQVAPLRPGPKQAQPQRRPKALPTVDEDSEVLAQLADLVSGALPLDVRDTEEYVEGAQPGLSPEILRRLSEGRFSIGDHLDLHGLTVPQARQHLTHFIQQARQQGLRCLLVIHGRGKSSPLGQPILKPHLIAWLSRSGLRRHVLAFTTARPYDGGAGAIYVLLTR